MSNLATMLQRAGLLPEDEATRIREFAYANKVPLVEVVIDRGFATEDSLVKFLQSKLMIPEVEADLLDELERETLRHLPAELAWYHEVLPVSVDDVGNLTLAMADPTDLRAVDAVAGHTGAYLVRAVAPLTALRRALERYYGARPDDLRARIGEPTPPMGTRLPAEMMAPASTGAAVSMPPVEAGPAEPTSPAPTAPADATPTAEAAAPSTEAPGPTPTPAVATPPVEEPTAPAPTAAPAAPDEPARIARKRTTAPPSPPAAPSTAPTPVAEEPAAPAPASPDAPALPTESVQINYASAAATPPEPPARTTSARAPISTVRREPPPAPAAEEVVPPLSPIAFARVLPRVVAAADRDEITQVLLDFLAEGFQRVIMFVHLQQQLRGRDARGDDLLLEAVTQVRIPTTGPSLFREVIERGAPHFGPWRTDTKINTAFDQAMGGITGNVLLLPVKLRERVPILVYASNTPHPVDPRSLHELVDGISGALERLIFRRKSMDTLPKQS